MVHGVVHVICHVAQHKNCTLGLAVTRRREAASERAQQAERRGGRGERHRRGCSPPCQRQRRLLMPPRSETHGVPGTPDSPSAMHVPRCCLPRAGSSGSGLPRPRATPRWATPTRAGSCLHPTRQWRAWRRPWCRLPMLALHSPPESNDALVRTQVKRKGIKEVAWKGPPATALPGAAPALGARSGSSAAVHFAHHRRQALADF